MSNNECVPLTEGIPNGVMCQQLCEDFASINVNKNHADLEIPVPMTEIRLDAATSCLEPKDFKLISWNIDGLDERSLKERTKAVCNIISNELPNVAILQEVIPESLLYIEKHLPAYVCIAARDENYFTANLLQKNTVSIEDSVIIPFPTTRMGRSMLVSKITLFDDIPVCVINTHLESTRDCSATRINQLKQVFREVMSTESSRTVIAGGDLNLRDKELYKIGGAPIGVNDIWEVCGKPPEFEYTWDARKNDNIEISWGAYLPRLRFDRVFIHHSSTPQVVPYQFQLIGTEKIRSCGQYPSDHWGISVKCNIKH